MIYMLHAHYSTHDHKFIELFTSISTLEHFLANHPEIIKDEITSHDIDPK